MGPLLAEVKDQLVCTQSPHKVMSDNFTDEMLLLIQYIDNGNKNQVAAAPLFIYICIFICKANQSSCRY
jgi:hypothetical protein